MLTSSVEAARGARPTWARTRSGASALGEVGGEVGGAAGQRLGERAEAVLAAGDEDQLGARLAGESLRGRLADPARRAGDQRPCSRRESYSTRPDRRATCKDERDGRCDRNAGSPAVRRAARRRAGDAAGAVLRPRLRPGAHPVHGADVPSPDLVGTGPGPAGARRAVVVVGGLRLADQRRSTPRRARSRLVIFARDGGAADRLALRAGGVRRPRPRLRPRLRRRPRSRTSPSSCSPAPRTTRCATRCSASPPAPRSRSACSPAASLLDGLAQGSLWALALFLDMAGPYFFGSEGWKLVPGHFAERHGLIVIIALGESIVAIGAGAAGVAHRRHRSPPPCSASPSPPRCGGSTSTSSRWSPGAGWREPQKGASSTRWPATPTPICTFRWSPGSSSSLLG